MSLTWDESTRRQRVLDRMCKSKSDTPRVKALFKEVGSQRLCPPGWFGFGACGIVAVAPNEKAQRSFVGELHRHATHAPYPIRIPHHSVSRAGLWQELDLATGNGNTPGILVLDDLESWDLLMLERLAKRIKLKSIPVTVVALANRYDQDPEEWARTIHSHADALGFQIVYLADVGAPEEDGPPSDELSDEDLDTINQHRRGLGMAPLDMSAGWGVEELRAQAESIRKTGRMGNPRTEQLKRRLMR